MDMRKYITQKLDNMKSVTEKNMLRDVMEEIFIPMYDHVEGQYHRLERRVRDQLPFQANQYTIWCTIMERKNAVGGCPYLYPMLEEDLDLPAIEIAGLRQRLEAARDAKKNNYVWAEQEVRLDTVFVQADYLACKEIESNQELIAGVLLTDNGEYKMTAKLSLSKRYIACVANLYRLFISNNIPWQTVYAPYMFKMFDIIIVHVDSYNKDAVGKVLGYKISYGEHASKIKTGLVPVWNVRKLHIVCEDFPLAAIDKVNYEYVFDLSGEGVENGYLADYDNADISATRREKKSLIVTSPLEKGLIWDMYKIMKRKEYVTEDFSFDLTNNAQEDSFAGRMIAYYGTVIKTHAELQRLLAAYDVLGYVTLESVEVLPPGKTGETYEVNSFLLDEIRDIAAGKTLMLKFKAQKNEFYLNRDAMSFLVSQVQIMYPDFFCVGVLTQ